MANYFTTRIIDLHLTGSGLEYTDVVAKYPQYQSAIDAELKRRGYAFLIPGDETDADLS